MLDILEEGLEAPLTFDDYPMDEAWLCRVRERINRALAEDGEASG